MAWEQEGRTGSFEDTHIDQDITSEAPNAFFDPCNPINSEMTDTEKEMSISRAKLSFFFPEDRAQIGKIRLGM